MVLLSTVAIGVAAGTGSTFSLQTFLQAAQCALSAALCHHVVSLLSKEPSSDASVSRKPAKPRRRFPLARVKVSRPHGIRWQGIRNLGATCYMNSYTQVLFHLGVFRRLIFSASGNASNQQPTLEAMQRLFYKLAVSKEDADCGSLLPIFGWKRRRQQDCQEFAKLLLGRLEDELGQTPLRRRIKKIFAGKLESYVKCINVNYRSSKKEPFYDLTLDIGGKDLGEDCLSKALQRYTSEEILDGENSYEAGPFGHQPAKKGVRILQFPNVLTLHLNRSRFDPVTQGEVKLNKHFSFPTELNLDDYCPGSGLYSLFAVIVHKGQSAMAGHYYSYVRPSQKGGWFIFNDMYVRPISGAEAVEGSFGGSDDNGSAYMLLYIRSAAAKHILKSPKPEALNPALCKKEAQLARLRQAEETSVWLHVLFTRDVKELGSSYELPTEQEFQLELWRQVKDLQLQLRSRFPLIAPNHSLYEIKLCSQTSKVELHHLKPEQHLPDSASPVALICIESAFDAGLLHEWLRTLDVPAIEFLRCVMAPKDSKPCGSNTGSVPSNLSGLQKVPALQAVSRRNDGYCLVLPLDLPGAVLWPLVGHDIVRAAAVVGLQVDRQKVARAMVKASAGDDVVLLERLSLASARQAQLCLEAFVRTEVKMESHFVTHD